MKPLVDRRLILIGGIILVFLGVGVFFSDLPLYLRIQASLPDDTAIRRTFAWTPAEGTPAGPRPLVVEVDDGQGGKASQQVTIVVSEPDTPVISDIGVTPAKQSVRINWKTDRPAISGVSYDINDKLRRVKERAVPGTAHEVTIDQLVACSTYRYKITARAAGKEVATAIGSFTTTGCAGEAAVLAEASVDVDAGAEGNLILGEAARLSIPKDTVTNKELVFQAKQLNRDQALQAIGAPAAGLSALTSLVELVALSDTDQAERSFAQPVQIVLAFTPAADTNLTTLKGYRYDTAAGSWQELTCTVDEAARTLTCPTTQFSAVAGFASGGSSPDTAPPSPTPTPPLLAQSGGSSGGGDGGGGGGGGGEEAPTARGRAYTFRAASGHQVTGAWSGIVRQGKELAVRLAHPRARMSRRVSVDNNNYYLKINVRNDRPGPEPVKLAVYLNGRAWKVISLDRRLINDRYSTYQVGLLRRFRGGLIAFRFLNDTYDRKDPSNEQKDRNLFIKWWRLEPAP